MNLNLLIDKPFTSWQNWKENLASIQGAQGAFLLSKMIKDYCTREKSNFVQAGPLTATNSSPIILHFLEQWKINNWELNDINKPLSANEQELIIKSLRELNNRRQTHPALSKEVDTSFQMKTGRIFWFTILEQQWFSRKETLEIGRATLLYGALWKDETGDDLFKSVYNSIEIALGLNLALYYGAPYISDWKLLLKNLNIPETTISELLDELYVNIDTILQTHSIENYPENWFVSPFATRPVVSLSTHSLFVPEPHYLLGSFETQRHLAAIKFHAAQHGENGFNYFSSTFGRVLERYVKMLLRIIADDDAVLSEFKYKNRKNETVDSPDIFLLLDKTIIIECKTARLPDESKHTLSDLRDWLWHLTGGNEKRSPFKQGSLFVEDWQEASITMKEIPPYSADFEYMVISYADLPATINMEAFRRQFIIPNIEPKDKEIERKTLFISMRDLEKIAVVAYSLRKNGQRFDLLELIKAYRNDLLREILAKPSGTSILAGLGDYCMEKYPLTHHYFPEFLDDAYKTSFQNAYDLLFGTSNE